MTLLAAQAAVAIENAGSVQRDALRRAVQAQEVERRRLARELHDETGQALTSILLGLAAVERSESAEAAHAAAAALRELVVETLQNVRRLAVELRPSALDDFGLEPALRRLGQTVREGGALDVQVEARLGGRAAPGRRRDGALPHRAGGAHERGQARGRRARQHRADPQAGERAGDDRGRRSRLRSRGDARSTGLGLLGMRERVELLDGSFQVEAAPGAGTTLIVELPLA